MLDAATASDTTVDLPCAKPVTGDEILIRAAAQWRAAARADARASADYDRMTAELPPPSPAHPLALWDALQKTAYYKSVSKRIDLANGRLDAAEEKISETQPSGLHGVMIQLEYTHLLNKKETNWHDWIILQPACLAFKTMSAVTGITSQECLGVFAICKKDDLSCFCRSKKG